MTPIFACESKCTDGKIYVLGAFKNPGAFCCDQIRNEEDPINAVHVLATVGGFAKFAKQNQITVISKDGAKRIIDLSSKAITDPENNILTNKNYIISPGEVIYASERGFDTPRKTPNKNVQENRSR
jgi:protein involved in polysaccharide export with SLBB domain